MYIHNFLGCFQVVTTKSDSKLKHAFDVRCFEDRSCSVIVCCCMTFSATHPAVHINQNLIYSFPDNYTMAGYCAISQALHFSRLCGRRSNN